MRVRVMLKTIIKVVVAAFAGRSVITKWIVSLIINLYSHENKKIYCTIKIIGLQCSQQQTKNRWWTTIDTTHQKLFFEKHINSSELQVSAF